MSERSTSELRPAPLQTKSKKRSTWSSTEPLPGDRQNGGSSSQVTQVVNRTASRRQAERRLWLPGHPGRQPNRFPETGRTAVLAPRSPRSSTEPLPRDRQNGGSSSQVTQVVNRTASQRQAERRLWLPGHPGRQPNRFPETGRTAVLAPRSPRSSTEPLPRDRQNGGSSSQVTQVVNRTASQRQAERRLWLPGHPGRQPNRFQETGRTAALAPRSPRSSTEPLPGDRQNGGSGSQVTQVVNRTASQRQAERRF